MDGPSNANETTGNDRNPLPPGELTGCRVLLAEDNAVNQAFLSMIIMKKGATVQVVTNGALAVAAAMEELKRGQPFDIVFMDMQMPVMDGATAVRELRKQGYPGKVVAFTASSLDSDREECLRSGCDDFVIKPVSTQELIGKIKSARDKASLSPSAFA